MYNNNQNHHNNDNNMNKDESTTIYPEFISISNEIKTNGSTNSYLNNIRREMLSMVNSGNNSNDNINNDSIVINMDTINNNNNNNNNNSNNIDINKSGYSQISNTTSNDNLNKTLLGNNEISQINDIDDDSSPEFIKYKKFISSLSYITFIGAAIVLINQKKSVYIQFHAYQSFYISMGVIGFQFLLIWSDILSIILWSLYLLFTIFMFLKVSFGGYGNSTIYKLPIIGNLSEQKAKLRSQEYSRYFKYHEDLFIKELREHKQALIHQSNLNRNNNNSNNVNNNGHQRINSNSSSVVMSSDVESMLNSSGSNSSIYSDVQNDIGTNEE
ncbi:hypothetical protein ACTFIW_006829 [Dictyostelium discoideum]